MSCSITRKKCFGYLYPSGKSQKLCGDLKNDIEKFLLIDGNFAINKYNIYTYYNSSKSGECSNNINRAHPFPFFVQNRGTSQNRSRENDVINRRYNRRIKYIQTFVQIINLGRHGQNQTND